MNAKKIAIIVGKVVLLTIILVICFVVAAQLSGVAAPPAGDTPTTGNTGPLGIMTALLVSSFLQTAVLTYITLRSRWTGLKLTGALFLGFYGSMTVIAQIESIVYLRHQLPPDLIPKLFIMGAIIAALFSPILVFVLGKMKQVSTAESVNLRWVMSKSEWIWKLSVITVAYLFLYYSFGYFIAWKNPAVLAYYGGTDPGSFFAQLSQIQAATPGMFPFQALRALFWIALVLPIIRMLKGKPWEIGLTMALFFSVWSTQLLLPNPYMPAEVARVHLVETITSNFIFGWFMGWLLTKQQSSLRNMFRI